MILAGAIPACILALLVDRVFAAIETIVTPVSLLDGKNKDEKRRRKKREDVRHCHSSSSADCPSVYQPVPDEEDG